MMQILRAMTIPMFPLRYTQDLARQWLLRSTLVAVSAIGLSAYAQTASASDEPRTVNQWLARMHDASKQRSYTGTLVVSAGSAMSASRIWHVCDGKEQMERIETLTGAPRTTVRHNNDVITFAPDEKLAWVEKRESLGLFPELLRAPANQIPQFYGVRDAGAERIAGYMADMVEILPKDGLRFGYRIWSERRSGLVLKLQTLNERGRVLEQLAFTELNLDAPVRMEKLAKLMSDMRGYQVIKPVMFSTSLEKQGWRMKEVVPGFLFMSCHTREAEEAHRAAASVAVQCVYSDGLASVSLFIEPRRTELPPNPEAAAPFGATHSVSRRLGLFDATVLGEVPTATLVRFAQALERLP